MKVHSLKGSQVAENIKIVEEYRKLIRISLPSEEQLDRIDLILEHAISNPKLNDALNQEDENLAIELDLYSEEEFKLPEYNPTWSEKSNKNKSLHSLDVSSKIIQFPIPTQIVQNKKFRFAGFDVKYISSFLVGGILLFAICTCLRNKEPGNVNSQTSQYHSNMVPSKLLQLGNKSDTQASICNLDLSKSDEKLQEYYALYSELDKQVTNQQLKPLEIKTHVKQLQKTAEIRQKQLEEEQRNAEYEKHQAEIQSEYDLAQKWKDIANSSLKQSRQWLCLSRSVLALY